MKLTTSAVLAISISLSEAALRGVQTKRRTTDMAADYLAQMSASSTNASSMNAKTSDLPIKAFEDETPSKGGDVSETPSKEELVESKTDEEFVKEEREASEIEDGEKVDEELDPDEEIEFKWKEGLKPDDEDLILSPPDGIEEKMDPCLRLPENFTEEEYMKCMEEANENMSAGQDEEEVAKEDTVSKISSMEIVEAKAATKSTVYTFDDGTTITETIDAQGVKTLTTGTGETVTMSP